MAVAFMKRWEPSVEKNVRDFSLTLSEKDRRRFAAVQARQLGYGGVRYIAEVVGCSRRTVERGLAELDESLTLLRRCVKLTRDASSKNLVFLFQVFDVFCQLLIRCRGN